MRGLGEAAVDLRTKVEEMMEVKTMTADLRLNVHGYYLEVSTRNNHRGELGYRMRCLSMMPQLRRALRSQSSPQRSLLPLP